MHKVRLRIRQNDQKFDHQYILIIVGILMKAC